MEQERTNDRRTFLFNTEWYETMKDYPAEVRLEVYDAIMRYAQSGTLSQLKPLAEMAFSFIRREMDYNRRQYDSTVEKRRQAARARWKHPKPEKGACAPDAPDVNASDAMQKMQVHNVQCIYDNDDDNDNDIKEKISSSDDDDKKESSSSSSSPVVVHHGVLKDPSEIMELIKGETAWKEAVCMNRHVPPDRLDGLIDEFYLHCRASGEVHVTLPSAKRHFNAWLGKKQREKDYENHSGNRLSERRGTDPGTVDRKAFTETFRARDRGA